MGKPSAKFLTVFNLVLNLPMAIAMSVTAPIVVGQPVFTPNLIVNILIGFVMATAINLLLPIPKISAWFAGLFKQKPDSFLGGFLGNIPVCCIFVVIIGLVSAQGSGLPVRLHRHVHSNVHRVLHRGADLHAHRVEGSRGSGRKITPRPPSGSPAGGRLFSR